MSVAQIVDITERIQERRTGRQVVEAYRLGFTAGRNDERSRIFDLLGLELDGYAPPPEPGTVVRLYGFGSEGA